MIFFPEKDFYETPEDYDCVYENVYLQAEDGVPLFGWFLTAAGPAAKGTLLFTHGNAGNISSRLYKATGWIKRGFSVFLIDYRGYGKSGGTVQNSKDILRDAQAGLKWLREEKKLPLSEIILYGESLGTYPAIRLGAENRVLSVVLEAPFTSFLDLAGIHYPYVPKALMRDFEFENEKYVSDLQSPVFILHGKQDEICPYTMSETLFQKAPEPKELFCVRSGTHNDLAASAGEDFWRRPCEFLMRNKK